MLTGVYTACPRKLMVDSGYIVSRQLVAALRSVVLLGAVLTGAAGHANTSASLSGMVTDPRGQGVSDAQVSIVHQPSGTAAQALTAASGAFFQGGLRVGGPFEIGVRAAGFRELRMTDVMLRPGPQTPLAIVLEPVAVDEVVVTAAAAPLRDLNNGVGSAYSAADMDGQPGIHRDVIRTLLRDPLAQSDGQGHLAVGGANPRFNGLAIDGSLQQDDFGLGANTYATERSPINLDAVESVSLVASDYSAAAAGFTGGLVQITTRSGTNEWDGSAFFYRHGDGLVGERHDGGTFSPAPFEETEAGVSIGGPIVRDRLFVFLSYDEFDSASPVDFAAYDAANGIRPGLFDALGGVLRDTYGYDPLGRPNANTPTRSERALAKLDWNLSDAHRLAFTWQASEEIDTRVLASGFESAWYDVPVDLDALSVQAWSDWTDRLATGLRVNRKTFRRGQICRAGREVGALELDLRPEQLAGTALDGLLTDRVTLTAGCDRFRHANEYDDERLQLYADVDYFLGDHIVKAGFEAERFELYNLFVPGSRGRFVFNGFDAVRNGVARVDYVNAVSNDPRDAAAAWGYRKRAFFIQDTWAATPDLELTAGLRYERFTQDDAPAYSAPIFAAYGVRTDANLDGADLWMPRLGIRYTGLERTVISGGVGLFAGGDPKVWTSNAFQPPVVFARLREAADVSPFAVPPALLQQVAAGTALPVDAIAEDFETPSDWKASIRMEREFDLPRLGRDFMATIQYLHTRTNRSFLWRNLAHTRLAAAQPTGQSPDGRIIYADLDNLGLLNLTTLGNHGGGRGQVFSAAVSKAWDFGFDFSASYAWQDVEAVAEGVSARGISNWRSLTVADRNSPDARRSPHQTTHSWKFNFGYERAVGGLDVRLNVFGRIFTGDLFTYTFDVDRGNALFGRAGAGESPYDANPLYVPAHNDAAVVYASTFDQDGFRDYIRGTPAGIHAPYSEDSGWNRIWDLRLRIELPGLRGLTRFFGDSRASVVLDIENFPNLLNDRWGRFDSGPGFGQAAIVRGDLVRAVDVANMGVDTAPALIGDAPRGACRIPNDCLYRFNRFDGEPRAITSPSRSVYRIRLGVRLDF